MRNQPDTQFAAPARKSANGLAADVSAVAASPVVETLLRACGGLVAVLNAERQIVAVNDTLLACLGVKDPSVALGLRPGEALHCVHRGDHPAGCGCSDFCRNCGAAVAIVSALKQDRAYERDCVMTAERNGELTELVFAVKAAPLRVDGQRFVLVFLQDVTMARRQAELSRVFFHDVSNLVQALLGACELPPESSVDTASTHPSRAYDLTRQLAEEVAIQRALTTRRSESIPLRLSMLDAGRVVEEVASLFRAHPLAVGKHLVAQPPPPGARVQTDRSLLIRVLGNMVTNALEATAGDGTVDVWCELDGDRVSFLVHNDGAMPGHVAVRVFQRHFTTKQGTGRGLGSYAMKLLGERHLGGKVDFTSNAADGTVFRLSLPAAV